MFKIMKKNYLSMVFIGLILSGCASTNSIVIKNLEKVDKPSYDFLKRTHSWVTIDTASENYSKWKNDMLNAFPNAPVSKVQECLLMKDSVELGTIEGKGNIGFTNYKNCLPTKLMASNKLSSVFTENNIFGWITVIQSNSKRWSQGIYEDYEIYRIGIIEYDNKAELFSDGSYRWGYSSEKDGVYAKEAFSKAVWTQDTNNVKIILNTLDKYNIPYTVIKN